MKNLLLALLAVAFVSTALFFSLPVGNQKKQTFKYDITYTDGTHEILTINDELKFQGESGCVGTCGCSGNSVERCGVRTFAIAPEKIVAPVSVPTQAFKDTTNKTIPFLKN